MNTPDPRQDRPGATVKAPRGTVLVPLPVDVYAAATIRARREGQPLTAWVAREVSRAVRR